MNVIYEYMPTNVHISGFAPPSGHKKAGSPEGSRPKYQAKKMGGGSDRGLAALVRADADRILD